MAIQAGGSGYPLIIEKSITIGDLTGLTSKTVTTTVPGFIDTTFVPVVTTTGLPDYGIGISHAWFSSPAVAGTTLNIKLYNIALATAVLTDPVTFKIVVL